MAWIAQRHDSIIPSRERFRKSAPSTSVWGYIAANFHLGLRAKCPCVVELQWRARHAQHQTPLPARPRRCRAFRRRSLHHPLQTSISSGSRKSSNCASAISDRSTGPARVAAAHTCRKKLLSGWSDGNSESISISPRCCRASREQAIRAIPSALDDGDVARRALASPIVTQMEPTVELSLLVCIAFIKVNTSRQSPGQPVNVPVKDQ